LAIKLEGHEAHNRGKENKADVLSLAGDDEEAAFDSTLFGDGLPISRIEESPAELKNPAELKIGR
jgi:twitching motility protein PilU